MIAALLLVVVIVRVMGELEHRARLRGERLGGGRWIAENTENESVVLRYGLRGRQ